MALFSREKKAAQELEQSRSKRVLSGPCRAVSYTLGVGLTVMIFYTAFRGVFLPMIQIGITLCVLLALTFLWTPAGKRSPRNRASAVDALLILLCGVCLAWTLMNNQRFITRIPYYGEVGLMDKFVGLCLLFLVLEAARRTVGLPIVVIAGVFVLYAFAGSHMPAMLAHKSFSLDKFVDLMYMTTEGLFGSLVSLCSSVLFVFVSFGVFLQSTGGDKKFMDLALAVAGKQPGGPAKVAVISSGAMGMISGSSVANVVTTGTLTIPMMKKSGFTADEAGAVEAVASSGGQITPPVMGTVAFLIADALGAGYFEVVRVAFAPALLFYLTVWFFVDANARKKGLRGLPAEELPLLGKSLVKSIPMVFPIAMLIGMLVLKYTPFMSGAVCTVLVAGIAMLFKESRLTPRKLLETLEQCAIGMTSIVGVVATASIIVGIISKTGLMIKSTSIIMYLSGGRLIPIILICLVISYIIGMGLPSATCYIILATLIAPALGSLGIALIEAHLMIFWFSQVAGLTPPVCITAFVAAGVAGGDPMKTGFQSLKMGSSFYFVPMLFLFSPLITGSLGQILLTAALTAASIYMLVAAIEGYLKGKISIPMRVLALVSCLLIFCSVFRGLAAGVQVCLGAAGLVLGGGLYLLQSRTAGRLEQAL